MEIYLFRHGIAIDRADPKCPAEEERYLTKKGVSRTREAARGLAWLGLEPELVLSSPLRRARETADIAVGELELGVEPIETAALLGDAAPSRLLEELAERRPASVLCAGHAPHLDELIAHLVGCDLPFTELKKAGLAVLHADKVAPGKAMLLAIYAPKALRRLGR